MLSSIISPLFALGALAAPSAPLAARQEQADSLWQPPVGVKWQIVISQPVNTANSIAPSDAPVIDVDLFATSESDISAMHSQNRKVYQPISLRCAAITILEYKNAYSFE
jgi:hypothetical protein